MLGLLAGTAEPIDHLSLVYSTIAGTELRIQAPDPSWESTVIRGTSYRAARLEGAVPRGMAGEPDLPVYHFAVAIPPGTRPEVEVVASDRVSYRDINIPPAPRTVVLPRSQGRGMEPLNIPADPAAVGEPYPTTRARILRTGRVRSLDIAYIEVSPFQYYPSQKLLCLDRSMTVVVKTAKGGARTPARQALPHDFMEPVLSHLVVNWEAAREWRQGPPAMLLRDIRQWDPPSPALKLTVDHEAYYSVTGAQLQAAGMPIASVNPATIQMLVGGNEIPIHVVGESDGRLDPQDRVEFVGAPVYREDWGNRLLPVGGEYTEANVYWLTWGTATGLRMPVRIVEAGGSGIRPSQFREQVHLERDLNPFVPNVGAISGDRYGTEWFWGPPLRPGDGRVYYSFTLRGLADVTDPVHLRASLRGYTHPDLMQNPHHHAVVYLNNVQLAHLQWYANDEKFYDSRTDTFYNPDQWPNNGALGIENHFAVEITGDTQYGWMDGAYTDWFEVDYWRSYGAWNDSLAFWSPQQSGPGIYLYSVTGFSDAGQMLVDLTHGEILQGFQETDLGVGGWAVKFRDSTLDSTRYLALALNRREPVMSIVEDTPSGLHASLGADFVVISHADLLEEAGRLTPGRVFNGTPLAAMLVDVQDVYDEYRFGVFDPRGIRDFLEDAYVNWPTPPCFVLLFGDASWDYKLNSPTSDPAHRNFVPSLGNPVMDDYFANVDDADSVDLLPDLYLARIPVENADTARIVVDKLLGYAGGTWDPGLWRENVFLIAGGHLDNNGNDSRSFFRSQCQNLIDDWVLPEPAHYNAILFSRPDSVHYNNEFETTEDESLQYIFNDVGVAHATYIGHGASWTWETMFWASDVENDLTNTRMLPMVNSLTCHTGRFANPEIDSFGEIWLWQPHGAMGFWGSTGWGHTTPDYYMAKRQFESIFRYQERTPIVALTYAKLAPEMQNWWADPMASPLFFTWLGDPLIPLALAERPDWTMGLISVDPQPIVSGDTVVIRLTVRNDGIDAGPATTLRLFDADPDSGGFVLTTLIVPPLSARDSTTVAWTTVTAGAAGDRIIYSWANPDTAQQEGYRGNNRGMTGYAVIDPVPDLATADSMLTHAPLAPEVLDSVITFTVGITNVGTAPVGPFRVTFVDSALSSGVLQELADLPVDTLARGGFTTVHAVWPIGDLDAGDHVVRVTVDSRDEIQEVDETNNTALASVHIASRAELVADRITPSNARPPEGDSLSLTGVWHNAGESPTPSYEVAIYHGHPDSTGSTTLAVESRESTPGAGIDSMTVAWDTLGQVGLHSFFLVVDRGGMVAELNEIDNVQWVTLEVVSGPDLYVSSFSLAPPNPVEGDSATVTFIVRNGGMIPADSFSVLLHLDGAVIREWRFDAAGRSSETLTHSWAWERGESSGDHMVEVVVDSFDEVSETNEDNNVESRPVYVMTLTDLAVSLTPSATALVDGEILTLLSNIANVGEAEAHTVRVWWHRGTDGSWSPVDSLVIPALAGGEARSESTSLVVHPGLFTFRATVSTPVEEQRLDNNEASCTVTVRAKYPPDLMLQEITLAADTVTVGETVSALVMVGNAGEVTPDSAWVELRSVPGDSLAKAVVLTPPAPGESSTTTLTWGVPHGTSGWSMVAACLPTDGVPGNESDTVQVVAVWPAELEAEGDVLAQPLLPLAGDTVTVTVSVRNSGERPAPLYSVALYRGDPSPGQAETAKLLHTVTPEQGLGPGDTATMTLHWATPDTAAGRVDLYVWIDAAQLVPERDEANNLVSTGIEILTRDFRVQQVLPIPSPAPGRTSFLVSASHEATATIRIYTVTGRLVQILGPTSVAPARHDAIVWECDDRDGDRVANGVYLYRAEATSARTGERQRHEGKVTVVR